MTWQNMSIHWMTNALNMALNTAALLVLTWGKLEDLNMRNSVLIPSSESQRPREKGQPQQNGCIWSEIDSMISIWDWSNCKLTSSLSAENQWLCHKFLQIAQGIFSGDPWRLSATERGGRKTHLGLKSRGHQALGQLHISEWPSFVHQNKPCFWRRVQLLGGAVISDQVGRKEGTENLSLAVLSR